MYIRPERGDWGGGGTTVYLYQDSVRYTRVVNRATNEEGIMHTVKNVQTFKYTR